MGKRDYAISEFYIKYNDIDKKEQVSSFQTDSGQKMKTCTNLTMEIQL